MDDDSIVFENVWGATLGYGDGRLTVIRENEDDIGESFNTCDWDITVTLTPKKRPWLPGWYMDRFDLEHPSDDYTGTATELTYYTQDEIDSGMVPDSYWVRVQVVPYPES
jgi:hypothetical protein